MRLVLTAFGLALVLAACAPRHEAPPPSSPPPSSLDTYKRTVALDVLQHALGTYCQPGEEMLKSIVVVNIAIDADGRLVDVAVVRSNGHPELAQRALDTVKAAAPFTPPGSDVQFLETYLFREDDCFHIRSLVR
jgi:periplasmic protein TonB